MTKKLFLSLAGIILFLTIFFAGIPLALSYFMLERKISPAVMTQYRTWKDTPIILPKEAFTAAPFQRETIKAAIKFRGTYAKLEKKAEAAVPEASLNEIYHNPSIPLPTRQMDAVTSLVTAFETLVKRPDYEVDAEIAGVIWKENVPFAGYTIGGLPQPSFTRVQTSTKLLALKAIMLAREGKDLEALDEAEMIFKSAQTSSYAAITTQLIGIAGRSIGTSVWTYAVDQTADPRLLENSLKDMNNFAESQAYFPEKLFLKTLDEISSLRWLKRQGWTIPEYQGCTGPELCWRAYASQRNYIQQVVLPRSKEDPTLKSQTKEIIDGIDLLSNLAYRMGPRHVSREYLKAHPFEATKFAITHESLRKYLFSTNLPESTGARLRVKTVVARFNLLRLKTARKLYRLREGHEAPDAAALVPKYLPRLPEDPFDAKTKAFKLSEVDYSLGPDGIDQKTAICYDPTNGTASAGDIFLK
jgi:hypothetical protein